jgi:hypothetical protein
MKRPNRAPIADIHKSRQINESDDEAFHGTRGQSDWNGVI